MKLFKRQPKPEITDTHELLRQIEQKDAAFRVTQFVFFVIALAFLCALLVSNYRIQAGNTNLIKSQSQVINNQKNEIAELKNTVNTDAQQQQKYIKCLVDLSFVPPPVSHAQVDACEAGAAIPPNASSSGGATGSTKSGSVNAPATSSPQSTKSAMPVQQSAPLATPQPNPNGNGSPTPKTVPKPKHPLICTLTLKLLGC